MNEQKQALYWSAAENINVRCGLCPHRCNIPDNARGVCGVRENRGGKLIASGYGLVSSVAIDPIEKKPLYMFHPGKRILSIGGLGCNLHCPFCQNHEIASQWSAVSSRQSGGDGFTRSERERWLSAEDAAALAVKTIPEGNIGIAYTYNEPLIGYEFLYDCAVLISEMGLKNVIVTNGYLNREPLEALLPLIDAMNIDLKAFTGDFYKKVGGDLETVKESISLAHKHCHVEVTTLVIPGENEDDVGELAKWLSTIDPGIPLHLSRFFPRYRYSDREPTPRETVIRLRETAGRYLSNVFTGNMG